MHSDDGNDSSKHRDEHEVYCFYFIKLISLINEISFEVEEEERGGGGGEGGGESTKKELLKQKKVRVILNSTDK